MYSTRTNNVNEMPIVKQYAQKNKHKSIVWRTEAFLLLHLEITNICSKQFVVSEINYCQHNLVFYKVSFPT